VSVETGMDDCYEKLSNRPVLVIGAAGLDIIGKVEAALEKGTSNAARIQTTFGGVARNVAENLARLGQDVRLVTSVGDDEAGRRLLEKLDRAGVDVGSSLVSDAYPTGAYIGVVNRSGELQYALDDMKVLNALSPEYLKSREDLFMDASILFIDANLSKKTLRTAMALAKKAGIPVFADPTSIQLAAKLTPFLSGFDLITPNVQEAAVYLGRSFDPYDQEQIFEAAKHLVGQGVKISVITLAELGVCYATSETSGYIQAVRTEIVDPTGAGDALTATIIFALLNQINLDDAMRLGVSAASLTLRYPGAVVPDLTLEKLYDQLVI